MFIPINVRRSRLIRNHGANIVKFQICTKQNLIYLLFDCKFSFLPSCFVGRFVVLFLACFVVCFVAFNPSTKVSNFLCCFHDILGENKKTKSKTILFV